MSTAFDQHPTVKLVRARSTPATISQPLDAAWLRQLCLKAGADDVGFVSVSRPELDKQREEIQRAFPPARTAISIICRMNRENVRNPARSTANVEFHQTNDYTNEVAKEVVRVLEACGIRAFYPPVGFPMEFEHFPKAWLISHKPIAVAAGLGQMGIHRNVIHPKFGNFILLNTILIDAEVSEENKPVDFNPCLECKLCVAACPVGAIGADGNFNFTACYTHNYREFMGGFSDWVENLTESSGRADYRSRFTRAETNSMWQSLSFGPNYKAAYCMAVCPAGEDVISPFLQSKKDFVAEVVRPLQEKVEPIYVVKGSDAEAYVQKRYPHKRVRQVHNGLIPRSVAEFLGGLSVGFQREQSKGLNAMFHFIFTGEQSAEGTVVIRDGTVRVEQGLQGKPDLRVQADGKTWIRYLNGETNIVWALLRRKIRLRGSPRLLLAFAKCFPG